uniref:Uncharacterized protein n=1 Tax=Arundo donax TaxID=35708 RepID=A0A0A9HDK9_ARUDO
MGSYSCCRCQHLPVFDAHYLLHVCSCIFHLQDGSSKPMSSSQKRTEPPCDSEYIVLSQVFHELILRY